MKSTLLLVDDDPVDLKALQGLVESWGFQGIAVRSGREAVEQCKSSSVDAVISDVRMPEMSGVDVVRELLALDAGLPVLLITGQGDVKSAVAAMKLGAFDYVLKPPDPEEFKLALERALEHSRLRRENRLLRAQLRAGGVYGERLIGRSTAMLDLFELINRVARTDSTVLITGETGTGKELVAQTIHYKSQRADQPFVALNCAAVNANLIESELFGHEKGAFTGAVALRRGRFESADGGTLFLDEIGETSPEFQSKLLRVLQEGRFERVGGSAPVQADVRLLASTNRDLAEAVKAGRFREDLYYRLSVIPVNLPPLRERAGDVELLAGHFAEHYAERYGLPVPAITDQAMALLKAREWKGNVRELQHAIERAVVLSSGGALGPDAFRPVCAAPAKAADLALQPVIEARTREHLLRVLDQVNWRKGRAAELLGLDRATLYRLLRKHSIERLP